MDLLEVGLVWEFPYILGEFCLCVFVSSIGNDPNKKTHKQHLPPAQSRDNPANLFMFMCFSLFLDGPYFSRVFSPRDGFSKSISAFY